MRITTPRPFRHDTGPTFEMNNTREFGKKIFHFLVGEIDREIHGRAAQIWALVRSLFVLPASCLFSVLLVFARHKTVVCIARNGHAQASIFLNDFEPLKTAVRGGWFKNSKVVLVADLVPLGPALWSEIAKDSSVKLVRWTRLYRCLVPHRNVRRIYLPLRTESFVYSGLRSISDKPFRFFEVREEVFPKITDGATRFDSIPTLVRDHMSRNDLAGKTFVAMQIQRPEMFWSFQQRAGRRPSASVSWTSDPSKVYIFPDPQTYEKAAQVLSARGLPVLDLWKITGNAVDLFSRSRRKLSEEAMRRDEAQAWIFSNCDTFVAGTGGAWWIAWALGRPTIQTDSYATHLQQGISLFLPVLLWDRRERRLLKLSEAWGGKGIYWNWFNNQARLEPIRNTALEIADAVSELRDLQRGDSQLDTELQARVFNIALATTTKESRKDSFRITMPILGQKFLEAHFEILG